MSILPIGGPLLQQALPVLPGPDASSAVMADKAVLGLSPDATLGPDIPVPAANPVEPASAELVIGDTPGDEILAGLNKRWGRFKRLGGEVGSGDACSSYEPVDGYDDDGAIQPHGEKLGRWVALGDDDDDMGAEISRSHEGEKDEQGLRFARTVDDGVILVTEVSKTVHSLESSLKTLMTSQ